MPDRMTKQDEGGAVEADESTAYVTQERIIKFAEHRWLLRDAFIDPEPSPTCQRKGHVWGPPRERFCDVGVQVRWCSRCAKRGAYVALTEEVNDA